jgi:hypothetical protein
MSGSHLICGWWVTGLVGFTVSVWLPDPFGRALAGATGLALSASWMGYPLILVFATLVHPAYFCGE